jgi:hypothetical protein
MSATTNRKPNSAIVYTIQDALTALQGAVASVSQSVFEAVYLFDAEQIEEAFKFLTVVEQRVALVVPLIEGFARAEGTGTRKYVWTRSLPVLVICADRVLGDRVTALYGTKDQRDPDGTVGSYGLAEFVLPALSGLLIPGSGKVLCEPKSMAVLTVKDTESSSAGRVAVALEFECTGGVIEADLPLGPVL